MIFILSAMMMIVMIKLISGKTSEILTMDKKRQNPIKIDVFTHFAPIPWQLGGELSMKEEVFVLEIIVNHLF